MGAHNTKSKSIPSSHFQNLKQKQANKTKVSPQNSNPEDLSWLDSNDVTAPQVDYYTTNLSISPSLINYFGRFYNKQIKALKDTEGYLYDQNKKAIFIDQLMMQNNITKATAETWVHAYVDYMILMAWFSFAIEEKELYAPFAIQQTQRLHISYQSEYRNFCNIINEKRGLIHYSPKKMASNSDSIEQLEALYDELKDSIMIYIYDNQDIYDSNSRTKTLLVNIWESFYETFIKNEYSFYISNIQDLNVNNSQVADKEAIEKAISNILTNNHNFAISYDGVDLLRESLHIPINYNGTTGLEVFPFIKSESLVSEDAKLIAKTLDESKLPLNFARVLSWEQAISIDKAREWIIEYKKFLFLTSLGKPVKGFLTEEIKQVWLLHLSFTKNYQKFMNEQTSKASNTTISQLDNIKVEVEQDSAFLALYNQYFGEGSATIKSSGSYINFTDSILKKQETLLNEKLARTLISV